MTPVIDFECSRPVDGHRVVSLDERKLVGFPVSLGDEDPFSVVAPPNATEDERYLLKRWGALLVQTVLTGDKPAVVQLLLPRSAKTERFRLFDRAPALFGEVASAQTTVEAVTALADQYGSLLCDRPPYVDDWYALIRALRRVVAAWEDAASTGDYRKVTRLIRQRAGFRWGAMSNVPGTAVNVFLTEDEASETGGRLCVRPGSLADALWVQLTLAIDAKQNLVACVECRKWFPVEAGAARSDKQYCSDACKMRAYRKRKKGVP